MQAIRIRSNLFRLAPCRKSSPGWPADLLQLVAGCSAQILKQPLAINLRLEIARALYETGQPERALAALDGLAPSQVDSPEAQYWKARCYNRLALAAYLRLFAVDPDSYRAHQVLGDMDEAREEDSKAIEEYEKALASGPHCPIFITRLAIWSGSHTRRRKRENNSKRNSQ